MAAVIQLNQFGLDPVTSVIAELMQEGVFTADPTTATTALLQRLPPGSATMQDLEYTLRTLHERGELFSSQDPSSTILHRRLFKHTVPGANGCWTEVVCMNGEAPQQAFHVHDHGEIWYGIPIEGDPRFDDFPAGWGYFPVGHSHLPKVTGGKMILIYFWLGGPASFPHLL